MDTLLEVDEVVQEKPAELTAQVDVEQSDAEEAAPGPAPDPMVAFYAALARVQADATNVQRNAVARITSQREYRYATLDAVRDVARRCLSAHGFAFVGFVLADAIEWTLAHSAGGRLTWRTPIVRADNPQVIGTQLTYMTRYQLQLLIGVAAEEDDDAMLAAEAASGARDAQHVPPAKSSPGKTAAPKPASPDVPVAVSNKASEAPVGDARTQAMDAFWRAWSKAGKPSWKTSKDAARAECDAMLHNLFGEVRYLRDLSPSEIWRVVAAMDPDMNPFIEEAEE